MPFTSASPSPSPPSVLASVRSPCTNGSKIFGSSAGSIPVPVSLTRISASFSPTFRKESVTSSPRRVNFAAL